MKILAKSFSLICNTKHIQRAENLLMTIYVCNFREWFDRRLFSSISASNIIRRILFFF